MRLTCRGLREDETRWRIGLPGAREHWLPKWPIRGLSGNEIACALISMMARSKPRSNQRPDTLMQDRNQTARRKPLATHGRTIHSGQSLQICGARGMSALHPIATESLQCKGRARGLPCCSVQQIRQLGRSSPSSRAALRGPWVSDNAINWRPSRCSVRRDTSLYDA